MPQGNNNNKSKANKPKVANQATRNRMKKRPPIATNRRAERDPVRKIVAGLDLRPHDLLHKETIEWLDQLDTLFEKKGDPVGMPLFENNYPCPTTVVSNYGSLTVNSVGTEMHGWVLPNGLKVGGDRDYRSFLTTSSGGSAYIVGPNVPFNPGSVTLNPAAPVWITQAITGPMTMQCIFPNCTPLPYDTLTEPLVVQEKQNLEFRCVSMGVRFSYIGRLTDTEGYVEWLAPYEVPNATAEFQSYRRDPSYKRDYFSAQRTYTYYWQPSCDDIPFGEALTTVTNASPTRHAFRIRGLRSDDIV